MVVLKGYTKVAVLTFKLLDEQLRPTSSATSLVLTEIGTNLGLRICSRGEGIEEGAVEGRHLRCFLGLSCHLG